MERKTCRILLDTQLHHVLDASFPAAEGLPDVTRLVEGWSDMETRSQVHKLRSRCHVLRKDIADAEAWLAVFNLDARLESEESRAAFKKQQTDAVRVGFGIGRLFRPWKAQRRHVMRQAMRRLAADTGADKFSKLPDRQRQQAFDTLDVGDTRCAHRYAAWEPTVTSAMR